MVSSTTSCLSGIKNPMKESETWLNNSTAMKGYLNFHKYLLVTSVLVLLGSYHGDKFDESFILGVS